MDISFLNTPYIIKMQRYFLILSHHGNLQCNGYFIRSAAKWQSLIIISWHGKDYSTHTTVKLDSR